VYPKNVLYCYSKVANSYSCYHILFEINSIPQIKQQVLGWLIIVTRNLEYQEKIRRSLCTKLILYRIRLLLNKIKLDQIKILISWKYPYWTIEYSKFTASLHIDSPDNGIRDLNLISRSKLSFATKVIEIISTIIVETKGRRSSCNVINFGRYYVTVPSQKRGTDLDYNADLYHKKNKRDKIYIPNFPKYKIEAYTAKGKIEKHFHELFKLFYSKKYTFIHKATVQKINYVIIKWCNYFRYQNCRLVFRIRFAKIQKIANNSNQQKIVAMAKYRRCVKTDFYKITGKIAWRSWVLRVKSNFLDNPLIYELLPHTDFVPKIYINERTSESIFNKMKIYLKKLQFSKVDSSIVLIIRRQNGKCIFCKLTFAYCSSNQSNKKNHRIYIEYLMYHRKTFHLTHQDCPNWTSNDKKL
jgi:hypothetical protein